MRNNFLHRYLDLGAAGSAVANSTSQLTLLGGLTKMLQPLPAGYFDREGASAKWVFTGRISTLNPTPGTLNLYLMFGAIAVFDSGAIPINTAAAQTNAHWALELELVARSVGSGTSATLIGGKCSFKSHAVIGSPAPSAGGAGEVLLPYNTAPAVGAGFDSTSSQVVDLQAKWSVANAANSLRLETGYADLWI